MTEQGTTADNKNDSPSKSESSSEQPTPRIDWADPNVPVGNAPPLPKWPLALSICAWLVWVVFLVAMLLADGQTGAAG